MWYQKKVLVDVNCNLIDDIFAGRISELKYTPKYILPNFPYFPLMKEILLRIMQFASKDLNIYINWYDFFSLSRFWVKALQTAWPCKIFITSHLPLNSLKCLIEFLIASTYQEDFKTKKEKENWQSMILWMIGDLR